MEVIVEAGTTQLQRTHHLGKEGGEGKGQLYQTTIGSTAIITPPITHNYRGA